jgi:hypothetical protein
MNEIEIVEQNVTFVSSGLNIAEKMDVVRRICFSLVTLTLAFRQTAKEQGKLIDILRDQRSIGLSPTQSLDVAQKIDHLLSLNDRLILNSKSVNFPLWESYLQTIEGQYEVLDSLAETFRMRADEEFRNHVSALVQEAESEPANAANESWREFVATLHD